jgi:hypothetical protein
VRLVKLPETTSLNDTEKPALEDFSVIVILSTGASYNITWVSAEILNKNHPKHSQPLIHSKGKYVIQKLQDEHASAECSQDATTVDMIQINLGDCGRVGLECTPFLPQSSTSPRAPREGLFFPSATGSGFCITYVEEVSGLSTPLVINGKVCIPKLGSGGYIVEYVEQLDPKIPIIELESEWIEEMDADASILYLQYVQANSGDAGSPKLQTGFEQEAKTQVRGSSSQDDMERSSFQETMSSQSTLRRVQLFNEHQSLHLQVEATTLSRLNTTASFGHYGEGREPVVVITPVRGETKAYGEEGEETEQWTPKSDMTLAIPDVPETPARSHQGTLTRVLQPPTAGSYGTWRSIPGTTSAPPLPFGRAAPRTSVSSTHTSLSYMTQLSDTTERRLAGSNSTLHHSARQHVSNVSPMQIRPFSSSTLSTLFPDHASSGESTLRHSAIRPFSLHVHNMPNVFHSSVHINQRGTLRYMSPTTGLVLQDEVVIEEVEIAEADPTFTVLPSPSEQLSIHNGFSEHTRVKAASTDPKMEPTRFPSSNRNQNAQPKLVTLDTEKQTQNTRYLYEKHQASMQKRSSNLGFGLGFVCSLLFSPVLSSLLLLTCMERNQFHYGLRSGIGMAYIVFGCAMIIIGAVWWMQTATKEHLRQCEYAEFLTVLNTYDYSENNGYDPNYAMSSKAVPEGWVGSGRCMDAYVADVINGQVVCFSGIVPVILGILLARSGWKGTLNDSSTSSARPKSVLLPTFGQKSAMNTLVPRAHETADTKTNLPSHVSDAQTMSNFKIPNFQTVKVYQHVPMSQQPSNTLTSAIKHDLNSSGDLLLNANDNDPAPLHISTDSLSTGDILGSVGSQLNLNDVSTS